MYDIPHGKACAILLTAVLKFNATAIGERYREVARPWAWPVDKMSQPDYRQACLDVVQKPLE